MKHNLSAAHTCPRVWDWGQIVQGSKGSETEVRLSKGTEFEKRGDDKVSNNSGKQERLPEMNKTCSVL
jgi:hypothetical protein